MGRAIHELRDNARIFKCRGLITWRPTIPFTRSNHTIIGLRDSPSTKTIRTCAHHRLAPAGSHGMVAGKAASHRSRHDADHDPAAAADKSGGALAGSHEPVDPSHTNHQAGAANFRARHRASRRKPVNRGGESRRRAVRRGGVRTGGLPWSGFQRGPRPAPGEPRRAGDCPGTAERTVPRGLGLGTIWARRRRCPLRSGRLAGQLHGRRRHDHLPQTRRRTNDMPDERKRRSRKRRHQGDRRSGIDSVSVEGAMEA